MARLNARPVGPTAETHEGGPAVARLTAEQQLRRSVLSCLLWENEFYEDGEEIAKRIEEAANRCPRPLVASLAIQARHIYNLRHVPLLLLTILARGGGPLVGATIGAVIQRADDMTEFLAIYAKLNGVTPDKVKKKLSAQVKKGLATAFKKFDEYQLAKYDRAGVVRLRDVLFLSHPKPRNEEQSELWKRLVDNRLAAPDTWEVALSGGADKKETFERLMREGTANAKGEKYPWGYMALLRNLRNMVNAGCDEGLITASLLARKGGAQRVLPFRYIAAARACPQLEPAIDQALGACIEELPALSGKTIVLVDVSGSMDSALSSRSGLTRMDAAAALASIIKGDLRVFTFSTKTVEVPPRRGMAGVDAVVNSQGHRGTDIGAAVKLANTLSCDRLIVITDEQSATVVDPPKAKNAYMINVASYRNGVGYGNGWVHLDGFSEHVLRYIVERETEDAMGVTMSPITGEMG